MSEQKDCVNGNCFCKARIFVGQLTRWTTLEEIRIFTGESQKKTEHCTEILEMQDRICRDGNKIYPDNP